MTRVPARSSHRPTDRKARWQCRGDYRGSCEQARPLRLHALTPREVHSSTEFMLSRWQVATGEEQEVAMPTETQTREHPSHPESKRNDMSDDPYTDSGSSPPAVDSNPFPPLATDEYEALRESIYRFGVLVPVIVDLEGNVLDGNHRLKIYQESWYELPEGDPSGEEVATHLPDGADSLPYIVVSDGRSCGLPIHLEGGAITKWRRENKPVESVIYDALRAGGYGGFEQIRPIVTVPSYDPDDIARTLNLDRRHLTIEQRRSLVADLRAKGTSIRGIARATGAPKSVVADDVKQLSGAGQLKQPAKVKGLDGKTRTAKPKAPAKPKADKPDIRALAKRVREHRNPESVFETHLIVCGDCGVSGVPLAFESGSTLTMCEPCWDKCWAQWATEAS